MIKNAIFAAQARRRDQPHQFFRFCWEHTFQVGIVIEVVEALDQKVTGLLDIDIQARTRL